VAGCWRFSAEGVTKSLASASALTPPLTPLSRALRAQERGDEPHIDAVSPAPVAEGHGSGG
jgi:hypothetical protein